jgi:signal transduction histidine kinase
MLFRVVFNLAENAIKYAGPGAHVAVSTRADEGQAVLEVRDDGPGIPADDRDHIFDRFYRADPRANAAGSASDCPSPGRSCSCTGERLPSRARPARGRASG